MLIVETLSDISPFKFLRLKQKCQISTITSIPIAKSFVRLTWPDSVIPAEAGIQELVPGFS
jgi:hypothetical protein